MKAETNIKALAFDWVFKGLIALVCFLVKDIREDVKQLMQTVPALQAKVDILSDQRLVDKFRSYQVVPRMRQEEEITYDSLNRK
jgi:hypothetical protein